MPELAQVVKQVIDFAIAVTAILLAVSIALGFVEGQIGYLLGMPHTLSAATQRVLSVIACLVVALLAIAISNAVIQSLAGLF